MIKPTFYRLPEEKRRRIIEATVYEFSSTGDEKISINRIIKRAQISRGSFYQYFDDKVDLVDLLFKSFAEKVFDSLEQVTKINDGDIFLIYEKLFDILAGFHENEANRSLMKRLARNLKANDGLVSDYMTNRFNDVGDFRECSRSFSREQLRFKSDRDIELLSQILTGLLKNALFNFYVVGTDAETVRQNYLRKLEILSAGARL